MFYIQCIYLYLVIVLNLENEEDDSQVTDGKKWKENNFFALIK